MDHASTTITVLATVYMKINFASGIRVRVGASSIYNLRFSEIIYFHNTIISFATSVP